MKGYAMLRIGETGWIEKKDLPVALRMRLSAR